VQLPISDHSAVRPDVVSQKVVLVSPAESKLSSLLQVDSSFSVATIECFELQSVGDASLDRNEVMKKGSSSRTSDQYGSIIDDDDVDNAVLQHYRSDVYRRGSNISE
jgi:hypothetical protein